MDNKYYITLFLYFAVISGAVIFAFLAYKRKYILGKTGRMVLRVEIKKGWMLMSFVLLWGLLAFADCGKDYHTYKDLFDNAKDLHYTIGYHEIEIGFAFVNYYIRSITDSFIIYNIIVSFFFLFLIYETLYKLKNYIHFGWAVLAVSTMSYLQFMNLKRIYIAAAIIFWAMQFLIGKKYVKYFLSVILASLIHTSAAIMFLTPCMQLLLRIKFKRWHLIFFSLLGFFLIYEFRYQIFSIVISSRYEQYGVVETTVGLAQFVYHVPFLFLIIRNNKGKTQLEQISFILILFSFIVSSLGYFISMVGRMYVYFVFGFASTPSLVMSEKKIHFKNVNYQTFICVFFVLYFFMRIMIYCKSSLYLDGIMPYTSVLF